MNKLSDKEYHQVYIQHLELIRRCYKKVAHKYHTSNQMNKEDREADLYIRLKERESFENYDPSRREDFEAYMYFQIRSIVGHLQEKEHRSLNKELYTDDMETHQRLLSNLPSHRDTEEEYRRIIQDFSSQLNPEQAEILKMVADGYSGSEIAAIKGTYDMKISRTISSIKDAAVAFLLPTP